MTRVRSAHGARAPLTKQAEDYLKAVYEIERRGAPAATTDIAAALGVAAASVSGMLRRLSGARLVRVERYRGARLTSEGRRVALQLLRRHRVIESYLTAKLGFGWDDVDDEAERLEHAASAELVERMAEALGHPTEDPHGAPIPTAQGRVDERRLASLADLASGATARVARISDHDPAFLRFAAGLGLRPGTKVKVASRGEFDGLITLAMGRTRPTIGAAAAARVYVETVGARRRD